MKHIKSLNFNKMSQFGTDGISSLPPSLPPGDLPEGDLCPKCEKGRMGDWERGETDQWNWATEEHYTKPSDSEYRSCDVCGHEEEKEYHDTRNDLDNEYDDDRDIFSGNYFNLKKESQNVLSMGGVPPQQPPVPPDDFTDDTNDFDSELPARKDKEYFASIGVRIRVVSGDPQREMGFAKQALESLKEQIQTSVSEDNYEAWLSGHDEEPTK